MPAFTVLLTSPDFTQTWSVPADAVLSRVSVDGLQNGDLVVSEDPSFDIANFASASATFSGVIALWSVGTAGANFRQLDYPVSKGSNVIFLADSFCVVCLEYINLT